MDGQNVIVAVFASPVEAERARDRLIEIGIPATDIRMSSAEPADRATVAETDRIGAPRTEGFWIGSSAGTSRNTTAPGIRAICARAAPPCR